MANIFFADGQYIDFRLIKLKIVLPTGIFIGHNSSMVTPLNAGETLTIPAGIDTRHLVYNVTTQNIEIKDTTDYLASLHAGDYEICMFRSDTMCDAAFPHYVNGSFYNGDPVSENNDLPILPDTLYFLTGEEQSIYKTSLVACNRKYNQMQISLVDEDNLRVETLNDSLRLNPSDLGSSLSLKVVTRDRNINEAIYYSKDLAKVVTDPAAVVNTSPKLLFIGDSLTGSQGLDSFRYQLNQRLVGRGFTPQFVGTGKDTDLLRHEGIGGFATYDWVGRSSNNATSAIPVSAPGVVTRSILSNSFMKLATAGDLAAHPEWCYTNSYPDAVATKAEVNYATNPALGTYYIFDYANYLTDHSVDAPDIIHIALGTNDHTKSWFDIATRVLDFEWMIGQIRVAQPAVKIIVLPWHPEFQDMDSSSLMAQHAQAIIDSVSGLQTGGDSNIHISPAYAHMPKDFIYPETTLTPLTSRDYDKVELGASGYIHPSEFWYKCYAKALEAMLLSLI